MNVILIMADSWRFDYLGCYGNDWIRTPNIDKFAEEAIVFENAYAEGCPTIPCRRALLTGRYTLPYSGWRQLTPEDRTITDMLWNERIQSALITDTSMMHMPGYGYERGFDFVRYIRGHQWDPFYRPIHHNLDIDKYHKPVWNPDYPEGQMEIPPSFFARNELQDYLPQRQYWKSEADHMVAQVCKASLDYLEEMDRNIPQFFYLDSFDPHEPWDPPSVWDPDLKCPYDTEYNGLEIINPVPTLIEGYLTDQEAHHIRMLYAEKITMVDRWLGKVIDRLKETGLYDNSLIIFLSDHGEPFGHREHGHGIMRKCRPWPYEELSHIPLIIHHPEKMNGRVSAFVETVDILPTIMDFLNLKDNTRNMQGKSLLPLMRGESKKIKDFAITGYFNLSWSIITDDWSYIHWLDSKESLAPQKINAMVGLGTMEENTEIWTCTPGSFAETPAEDELYDRKKDPYQLNNLMDQKPDIANALFVTLRDHMLNLRASSI